MASEEVIESPEPSCWLNSMPSCERSRDDPQSQTEALECSGD